MSNISAETGQALCPLCAGPVFIYQNDLSFCEHCGQAWSMGLVDYYEAWSKLEADPEQWAAWQRKHALQLPHEKARMLELAQGNEEYRQSVEAEEQAKQEARKRWGPCGHVKVKMTETGKAYHVGIEEPAVIKYVNHTYQRFVSYGEGDSWDAAFAAAELERGGK